MAQFQLYNYQFGRIENPDETLNLFGQKKYIMSAEESFPKRQDIFQELFDNDYDGKNDNDKIIFRKAKLQKEYHHIHIISPKDGLIIMRIANKRNAIRHDKDLEKVVYDDYRNCIVIIDNRPGIQRIALEVKKSVFSVDLTLKKIIADTLNELLKPYCLYFEMYNLKNSKDFWTLVKDKDAYPSGFYKIKFHLPYLNLERLSKKYNLIFGKPRESFNCRMDIEYTAQKGGQLDFNENDEFQISQVKYFTEDIGGNSIEIIPNNNKKKAINANTFSSRYTFISDTEFIKIKEYAQSGDLFECTSLETIKSEMKKGID